MNVENLVSIIGWIGVTFCTIGFLLLNTRTVRFDSWIYQAINVIGGLGLVTSALYFRDMPNITSNSIWVIIAMYGLLKPYFSRRESRRKGVA